MSMAVIRHLIEKSTDFCGLIVTLLTNRDSTWLKSLNDHLPQLNVTSDWNTFKSLPHPRLLLVHYEALPKLIDKLVKYRQFNFACVDEAQRISNRGNRASRAMARLAWVNRRLVLTGTPQEVKETDYFGIFKFLAPEVFGLNWQEFEKRYMVWPKVDMSNAPQGSALWQKKILQQRILKNKAKFREEKRQEFINKLKPYCIRLSKADVGIKEANVHKVMVDMTDDQRRCYNELRKQSFTYLPRRAWRHARRVKALLPVTCIMKLRQVATGFVYDDEGVLHDLSFKKLHKCRELIDKLPKPIVVFTAFRPDNQLVFENLLNSLYSVVQVNGSTDKKIRPQIWLDFQAGKYDVAVVQTKTGGTGVDLWAANHAIVYSMSHSYRDWDQSKSRLDNRSKSEPSEFFVLCSKGSIDEDLWDLVIIKRLNNERTLKHLQRTIKMTDKTNPAKAKRTAAKAKPASAHPQPKYGIKELGEATGLQGASVRVALRALKIQKGFGGGTRYGWDNKNDFDAVVRKMKERRKNTPTDRGRPPKKAAE